MASHISRPAYGTDFSTILNEFSTDILQFSAKDGGRVWHLMCAPLNHHNVEGETLYDSNTLSIVHGYLKSIT